MTAEQPQIEPLRQCATCYALLHPDSLLDHSAWHGKQIEWFSTTNGLIEHLVDGIGLLIELRDSDRDADDGQLAEVIQIPGQLSLVPFDQGGPA
jgi:hypothetical protein